jgi:hypothetical protein
MSCHDREDASSKASLTGPAEFDRFRQLVLDEPSLWEVLDEPSDQAEFVALSVRLGQARGFRFEAHDVREALTAGRKAWIERWL